MKEPAMSVEEVLGTGERLGASSQDGVRSDSVSWWKHLIKKVQANLDIPFESDWEKKTGFHWREWGKL
jgi:hypothetical protein